MGIGNMVWLGLDGHPGKAVPCPGKFLGAVGSRKFGSLTYELVSLLGLGDLVQRITPDHHDDAVGDGLGEGAPWFALPLLGRQKALCGEKIAGMSGNASDIRLVLIRGNLLGWLLAAFG